MKMSGQKNKRLCGLIALDDAPLCAGMRLHVLAGGPDPGKEVGWITSAIRSERLGKEIALGYVKRGFNEIGTQLEARSATESASSPGGRVQLVDLPFR